MTVVSGCYETPEGWVHGSLHPCEWRDRQQPTRGRSANATNPAVAAKLGRRPARPPPDGAMEGGARRETEPGGDLGHGELLLREHLPGRFPEHLAPHLREGPRFLAEPALKGTRGRAEQVGHGGQVAGPVEPLAQDDAADPGDDAGAGAHR